MIVTGMVLKGSLSHCQDLLGHLDKAGQSLMLFVTTVVLHLCHHVCDEKGLSRKLVTDNFDSQ